MRHKATKNRNGPELVLELIQSIPTLRFQLRPSCCPTQRQSEKEELEQLYKLSAKEMDFLATLHYGLLAIPLLAKDHSEDY